MDVKLLAASLPQLLQGAGMTVKITALTLTISIILGTLVGLGRTAGRRWLNGILAVYVEVIRGTPLYTQLLLVVYGIPQALDIRVDEFTTAVICFGLNSGAYVSEIIRAGIQSVDRGQMEAARSLGMSHLQAMRYVILPQAFRRVIPPLVNESSTILKESSLVGTVALVELTRQAQLIQSRTFKPFTAFVGAALIYLVMTTILSRLAAVLERRLNASA